MNLQRAKAFDLGGCEISEFGAVFKFRVGVFQDVVIGEVPYTCQLDQYSGNIWTFAESIFFGSQRNWGRSWTQIEIDGFFFNHFLNPDLQAALSGIREELFGDTPFPCQWNDPDAQKLFVSPWGGNGNLGDVYQDLFPG